MEVSQNDSLHGQVYAVDDCRWAAVATKARRNERKPGRRNVQGFKSSCSKERATILLRMSLHIASANAFSSSASRHRADALRFLRAVLVEADPLEEIPKVFPAWEESFGPVLRSILEISCPSFHRARILASLSGRII
jgi:hypothetical protein